MFASYQRKQLFNRKIKKVGLRLNLKVLITFLGKVITFLCSLLDDYFVTFLAMRYYISMQLFYYISMQVLLHFYAGITFLCKVITFLCRLLHFQLLLHFYALHQMMSNDADLRENMSNNGKRCHFLANFKLFSKNVSRCRMGSNHRYILSNDVR